MAAATAMEQSLSAVAKSVAQTTLAGGTPPDVGVALNNAVIAYQKTVASAADNVFGDPAAIAAMTKANDSDGWLMAGSWFMKAASMQDAVNQVVSQVPTTTKPNVRGLNEMNKDMGLFF